MAEDLLDVADVGAAAEQMRRARVTEPVAGERLPEAGLSADLLAGAGRAASSRAGFPNARGRRALSKRERNRLARAHLVEVSPEDEARSRPDRHDATLAALALVDVTRPSARSRSSSLSARSSALRIPVE